MHFARARGSPHLPNPQPFPSLPPGVEAPHRDPPLYPIKAIAMPWINAGPSRATAPAAGKRRVRLAGPACAPEHAASRTPADQPPSCRHPLAVQRHIGSRAATVIESTPDTTPYSASCAARHEPRRKLPAKPERLDLCPACHYSLVTRGSRELLRADHSALLDGPPKCPDNRQRASGAQRFAPGLLCYRGRRPVTEAQRLLTCRLIEPRCVDSSCRPKRWRQPRVDLEVAQKSD